MSKKIWYEYAFKMMEANAVLSTDPHTKVGCVIFDKDGGKILGTSANRVVRKLEGNVCLERPYKYDVMLHADILAIFNAFIDGYKSELNGAIMVVPFPPCKDCAKYIIEVGIARVIYREEYKIKDPEGKQDRARELFLKAGVSLEKYEG